nr:hypothetical protein [Enterococcus sp. DIV2402]
MYVCFFSGSGRAIAEAAGTAVRNLLESDTQYKVNKLFLIFGRQQAQHYYVKEKQKNSSNRIKANLFLESPIVTKELILQTVELFEQFYQQGGD